MQTTSDAATQYATYLKILHSAWTPHPGQILVGRALFSDDIRNLFVQCGRKWGKSEIAMYILTRWALMHAGSACYYFGPQQKQAREILWERLKKFIPRELIAKDGINKTEGRITLVNGSFIKVDGSDNFEAYRGITPDIAVYDEFKDFRREFHTAFEPNLAPRNAPLIILGTPPENDCQYTELADEFRVRSDCRHFMAPTAQNPHIAREWLKRQKEKLEARGELDVWGREYEARFIKGGSNSIFPMFSLERHVFDHEELMKSVERDLKKFEWYTICDPGTATRFGALIAALNPYTKELYLFDEIYEGDARKTSTSQIWPRLEGMERELHSQARDETFNRVYDEAATWFANEVLDRFNVAFTPTHKSQNKKEEGLSLIKDQLLHAKVKLSNRCKNLIWEVENYIKDPTTGKIPKKNDHLIDCWRYLNAAAGYDPTMVSEPPAATVREGRRGFTPEEDMADEKSDILRHY